MIININRAMAALAVLMSLVACKQDAPAPSESEPVVITQEAAVAAEPAMEQEIELGSGIDMTGFNTSVRPQDDLFAYVNGKWVEETELPSDRSRWGTFDILGEKSNEDVRALIEEVSATEIVEAGSARQKIRDYYNTYIDVDAQTQLGIEAIRTELDEIAAIESYDDLFRAFGRLGTLNVNSPVGAGIFSDLKDPDTNVVYLGEAGLTLPDRDYYLKDDEQYVNGRELYRSYVSGLFSLTGIEDAEAKADELLALEHRLAQVHWTREDNRDPVKSYNPKNFDELNDMAPGIAWEPLLDAQQIPARNIYIVNQPSYFEGASEIIPQTSLYIWKNYLTFQTINAFAPALGVDYFQLWFEFNRAGLQGIDEPRPLWKRAVNAVNASMGELLGQLYVERHYQEESRERMEIMIENLIKAYHQSISELEWMSEETRQQALEKLSKFTPKIGYPEKWRDYSHLEIVAGDHIGNVKRAIVFEHNRNLDKLDKPVDKSEWFMTPQTVNAYYNPAWNEIAFPASILQPPFFNVAADDAVNYGAIGAGIGHEIGHGFDDQGRKFDGDGNLRDWWTEEDAARFEERKQMLAAQYNSYEVIDGLTINGEFTSGENIGDLGGLSIAYKAYKLSLNGQEAPVIDGLTGDQRFFIGWAQVWRGKARPEETKRLLTIDPHSPGPFRANGAAVNVPAFYDAFGVQEGDGMYLPDQERVKIW